MYSYVIGFPTPFGWCYKIQGDNMSSLTKKDCEHRIRSLCNSGAFGKPTRDYLLLALRQLKRGT